MRTSTICLAVLSAATTLASARPDTSYLAFNLRALSDTLYKREITIPSECTSTCDPVYDQVKDGCSVSTCCTESFEASYYQCIVCVGENADDITESDIADAQADFDSLYTRCYDEGSAIEKITLPGQNSSRTFPTSSSAATSHASTPTSGGSVASKTTDSPSSVAKLSSTLTSTSTTPSSHETATGNGRAASATPKSGSASLGVCPLESGVWALAAAIMGLVVI